MRANGKVACVLAAGLGSRLKSLTSQNTKCMVEVGGTRLISYLLDAIQRAGFDEIVVVVGHGAASLTQYINSSALPRLPVYFVDNRILEARTTFTRCIWRCRPSKIATIPRSRFLKAMSMLSPRRHTRI